VTLSVSALLRAHGLHPKKGLGQNFLTDRAALERIVAAADLSLDDAVVEVGAGLGFLTQRLAEEAGLVVAVELDADLVEILREQVANLSNVRIIHSDILQQSDLGLAHREYKVVANLPYYVTSAVLRHFLEREPRPRLLVVTVQHEVAERIVAKPGAMSLLALSVQFYGQARIVARIPARAFYPTPKVDSAIVRIEVAGRPNVTLPPGVDETAFFRVSRAGFQKRRKMLRNSLSAGLGVAPYQVEDALRRAGVDPRRRPQTLSLQEWAEAAGALAPLLGRPVGEAGVPAQDV
jgi:16S rRNA (adenine1518-N6/adenine1519-N6)-dimethyltransferase